MANTNSKTPPEQRDEWRTPSWLFSWLNARFKFDIDLAATRKNALVHNEAQDFDRWDALVERWARYGRCGFINPPYSKIDPWLASARVELEFGFTSVFLIPAPNGEERWASIFGAASEIVDIVGRISFIGADGTPVGGNERGSCIVVFTPGVHGLARRWALRDEIGGALLVSRKVEAWRVAQLTDMEARVFQMMQRAPDGNGISASEITRLLTAEGVRVGVDNLRKVCHMLVDSGFAREVSPLVFSPATVKHKEQPSMSLVPKPDAEPEALPERALPIVARLKKAETVLLDSVALIEEARLAIERLQEANADVPSAEEIARLREAAEKYEQFMKLLRP